MKQLDKQETLGVARVRFNFIVSLISTRITSEESANVGEYVPLFPSYNLL